MNIYNYFENLTNNFDLFKTNIVLNQMTCFRDGTLHELMNTLAMDEYKNNKWSIPTYKVIDKMILKFYKENGIKNEITDYKIMRNEIFPYINFYLNEIISTLEKKIEEKQSETNSITTQTISSERCELKTEITKDEIINEQNNLIPRVLIREVYKYFEVLTTIINNSDKYILTNNQLNIFIKSTFIDQKPIKQEWNSHLQTKKEVRIIFYEFYKKYKGQERNTKSMKRKYFNILNNSFGGFNETDYDDFHKR
jgi:hypothetical protein